jgi:hypothetical protein
MVYVADVLSNIAVDGTQRGMLENRDGHEFRAEFSKEKARFSLLMKYGRG